MINNSIAQIQHAWNDTVTLASPADSRMTAKCLLIDCSEERKKGWERDTRIVNLLVNEAIILPALTNLADLSGSCVGRGQDRSGANFQPGIIMLKPAPTRRAWWRVNMANWKQRGSECTQTLCKNWEDNRLIMGHCAVYLPHKGFTVDPQIAAGAERLWYIPMIQGQKNTVGSLIFIQLYYIRLLTCLYSLSQA